MASNRKILSNASQKLGFTFISKDCIAHGFFRTYHILLKGGGSGLSNEKKHILISFFVKGLYPTAQLQTLCALPTGCKMETGKYKCNIRMNVKGSEHNNADIIAEILNSVTSVLEANGFVNCDGNGNSGVTSLYRVNGEYIFLNDTSAEQIYSSLNKNKEADSEKKENYIAGFSGALLGALAASAVIFFIARIGFVSNLSSLLMGVGLVYGYKWKGVRLSAVSSGICIFLSIVFSYFVFRLDTAFKICSKMEISFADSFSHSKEIFQLADAMSTYYGNLILVAGLAILGTVLMVFFELSSQKKQFEIIKIN